MDRSCVSASHGCRDNSLCCHGEPYEIFAVHFLINCAALKKCGVVFVQIALFLVNLYKKFDIYNKLWYNNTVSA